MDRFCLSLYRGLWHGHDRLILFTTSVKKKHEAYFVKVLQLAGIMLNLAEHFNLECLDFPSWGKILNLFYILHLILSQ